MRVYRFVVPFDPEYFLAGLHGCPNLPKYTMANSTSGSADADNHASAPACGTLLQPRSHPAHLAPVLWLPPREICHLAQIVRGVSGLLLIYDIITGPVRLMEASRSAFSVHCMLRPATRSSSPAARASTSGCSVPGACRRSLACVLLARTSARAFWLSFSLRERAVCVVVDPRQPRPAVHRRRSVGRVAPRAYRAVAVTCHRSSFAREVLW